MFLTRPRIVSEVEAYRPLLDLLDDVLIKPKTLGERYGYSEAHLANLRANNRSWPFIKLGSGGVRYRLSEIISAEVQNCGEPITVDQVCQALANCKVLSVVQRTILQEHVRRAFKETDTRG